jgi:hypothetical protein
MANEFIVKNGLISQGASTISGSLTSTGNITAPQLIGTASFATATNSASYATTSSNVLPLSQSVLINGSLSANNWLFVTGSRVGINTTANAGFGVDINTNVRLRGTQSYSQNSTMATIDGGTGIFSIVSNDTLGINTTVTNIWSRDLYLRNTNIYGVQTQGGTVYPFRTTLGSAATGSVKVISLTGNAHNQFGGSMTIVNFEPSYDSTAFNRTFTGIYYNPSMSVAFAFSSSIHRAIHVVTGDTLLGTTSGRVGIGKSSPSASLDVTGSVVITGSLNVSGSVTATSFTGSLLGTASYATQALSASWAPSVGGGAAFPYTGSAGITGSLSVTGPTVIKAETDTTSSNLFAVQNAAGENMIKVIGETDVFIGNNAGGTGYGLENTAIGQNALASNETGTNNTAIGQSALVNNRGSNDNIAIGNRSLYNNDGYNNIALGNDTLYSNYLGHTNIALGKESLHSNNSGHTNIAIGNLSLYNNDDGYNNIAIGTSSLYNNADGTNNIAIGNDSLFSNTAGDYNIAIGQNALVNAAANNTVAIGLQAGESFTGTDSVIIGHLAGLTPGDESVVLGSGAQTQGVGSNQIVIGYNVTGLGANTAIIGNSNLIGIYNGMDSTAWDQASDARDKTNINTLSEGLSFINQIRPVQYEWNKRDGSRVGKKQIGFIAQELLAAQTGSAIQDHLYLANTSNPDSLTINQSDLIPILVKAIQDLSAEVENLKQQINP